MNRNRRNAIACLATLTAVAALPRRAIAAARKPDVIVIGAGLSGLNAARILEREGAKVIILEASHRVGGRVITLDEVPGRPEAGLAVIGGLYARVLDVCRQLRLPLEVPPQLRKTEATRMLYIGGRMVLHEEWPASPLNPLPEADRKLLPDMILATYLLRDTPLKELDDWISPRLARFDVSTAQLLRDRGLSEAVLTLADQSSLAGGIEQTSALHDMRSWHWATRSWERMAGEARRIVTGNQRLPEGMAAALKSDIVFGKAVVQIDLTDRDVAVSCADGSRYEAKRIISTLPFTVLRDIAINPGLPALQAQAINELPYTDALQVYMVPERAYWREDGMPPGMWTDTAIDSVRALANDSSGQVTNIICDIYGAQARRFRMMTEQQIGEYVLRELAAIRPSTKGALRVMRVVDKSRERFAAGDWSYWKPGQVTRFGSVIRNPWKTLHLAGDVTAVMNRGAEAAFESGERAALEVVQRI